MPMKSRHIQANQQRAILAWAANVHRARVLAVTRSGLPVQTAASDADQPLSLVTAGIVEYVDSRSLLHDNIRGDTFTSLPDAYPQGQTHSITDSMAGKIPIGTRVKVRRANFPNSRWTEPNMATVIGYKRYRHFFGVHIFSYVVKIDTSIGPVIGNVHPCFGEIAEGPTFGFEHDNFPIVQLLRLKLVCVLAAVVDRATKQIRWKRGWIVSKPSERLARVWLIDEHIYSAAVLVYPVFLNMDILRIVGAIHPASRR